MIQKNYILQSLNFKIQKKHSTGVQAEKSKEDSKVRGKI